MPGGTVVAPTSTQEPSFIKILRNSEFASELEIVKDQADVLLPKLDLIRRSYEALQKDIFASQDKSPLERAQAIHDAHIAYSDELTKAVSECLLPHQVERLSQLAIRVELANFGWSFKKGSSIREKIELTDKQAQDIFDNGPEFRKKLRIEVEEFVEKKRIEYLEKYLTEEQVKKLRESLGDSPFKPPFAKN